MTGIAELQGTARTLRPMTVPARHKFTLYSVLCFVGMSLCGIALLPFRPILGALCIAIFGPLSWIAHKASRPGAWYLALDIDGITQCYAFRSNTVQWTNIRSIGICTDWNPYATIYPNYVKVDYIRNKHADALIISPQAYGLSPQDLMNLLKPYYEHAHNLR
jgi:hypothetical protein